MTIFWFGLAALFIVFGLFILTQNTETKIGVPMVGIGLAIIFVLSMPAHGRDLDGRYAASPLKDWFNNLKPGSGALCCSDADGTALSDVDWETKDGRYRVRVDGEWVDVPDDAVITEPNRAGRTMVWPIRGYGGLTIRCFMPGSMT
jgi:hypothetical protein